MSAAFICTAATLEDPTEHIMHAGATVISVPPRCSAKQQLLSHFGSLQALLGSDETQGLTKLCKHVHEGHY